MVTFAPGETVASVNFTIVDDNITEPVEMFCDRLTTAESNVMFGDDVAFVTILDNDGELLVLLTVFQYTRLQLLHVDAYPNYKYLSKVKPKHIYIYMFSLQ